MKPMNTSPSLSQKLSLIRHQIAALNLPPTTYAGLHLKWSIFHWTEIGGEKHQTFKVRLPQASHPTQISSWLKNHTQKTHTKTIAVAILSTQDVTPLASKLWLKNDVVPFVISPKKHHSPSATHQLARLAAAHFHRDTAFKVLISKKNAVKITPLATLKDYEAITPSHDLKLLNLLTQKFKNHSLLFINATPQGGGVAIMRHALIRLFKLLGINAHWHVMTQNQDIFNITKTKIHNVLQKVAAPDTRLTPEDELLFKTWSAENAHLFKPQIKASDIIVIDDPQPSGLIPHIKTLNPQAKIIYRSHIHLDADATKLPDTPQHLTWEFIWQNIKNLDVFVSHPLETFLPDHVPPEKTVFMPATTDPLDGLNKPLSAETKQYYHQLFAKILLENNQAPLDPSRPYLIQIARFDPSKGIPHLIAMFSKLRQKLASSAAPLPQLVIVGNGSIDDPDGLPIYHLALNLIRESQNAPVAADIKIALLPHIDPLLNTLLSDAHIAFQLSSKEGFEVKVTEALMKGVPVIASKTGGIPLQIINNKTGFLVPSGDTDVIASAAFKLLTEKKLHQKMSLAARHHWNKDVTTVRNAINWLFLATELLEKGRLKYEARNALNHDVRGLIAAAHPHLFSTAQLLKRAERGLRAAKLTKPSAPEKLLKLR